MTQPRSLTRVVLWAAFIFGGLFSAHAASDTQKPQCLIKADYIQPGPAGTTKFTFVVDADDNVAVKRLEYRAAVSGGALGAFRPYPFVPGARLTFTVQCTAFTMQIRAVDTAGNVSPIQTRSYAAPFRPRPIPRPEPVFSKPTLYPAASAGQLRTVALADFNGDTRNDIVTADKATSLVKVRLNTGTGTTFNSVGFTAPLAPEALAVGQIFGPNGSAANDTRPDLVVVSGDKVLLHANNGGTEQATLQFPASDVAAQTTVVSTNFQHVAVGDVNGDGFDDIVGCGTGVNPGTMSTEGVVVVLLNKGVVAGVHGGFEAPVSHFTGAYLNRVALGDLDADGDRDIVALDTDNRQVAVLKNDGSGVFGGLVNFTTDFKPIAVALGDLTNDGYLDIALFGQTFTGTTNLAGVEVLRNTLDVNDNPGTFVSAGAQEFVNVPLGFEISFPGQIAMADVTLDGIPDLIFADHYGDSVRVIQLAAIRAADGTFDHFELEKEYKFTGIDGPLYLAVGRVNADAKPDIVTANFSTDQLAIFLNTKGNTKSTTPLEVIVSARPASDPNTQYTITGDRVKYRVTYANIGFDDETNAKLTVTVPPALEVVFTDTNTDQIDDDFGFKPTFNKRGQITAIAWDKGTIGIGISGEEAFAANVATNAKVGAKLTATGKLKTTQHSGTGKATVVVTTSITVEATAQEATELPGGIVEFRMKLRNRAPYAARGVQVVAKIPGDTHLIRSGTGAPGFLDGTGQLMFITGSSTSVDDFTRQITYKLAKMDAQSELTLRFQVLVPVDFTDFTPGGGPVTLDTVKVQQTGTKVVTETIPGQLLTTASFNVTPPVTPVNRPSIVLALAQKTAGVDGDHATVTTRPSVIPGITPTLKANQIRYSFVGVNAGKAAATDVVLTAFLPVKTKLDRASVRMNGQPVDKRFIRVLTFDFATPVELPEEFDGVLETNYLYLSLPDLAPNASLTGGSLVTLDFTVTLTAKAKVGDDIQTMAWADCAELIPFTPATPVAPFARVVPPAVLQLLKTESFPARIDPANPTFSSIAFFKNTGGIAATGVEVAVDVPPGASYAAAYRRDASLARAASSIVAPAVGATSGTVRFLVGSVPPGQTVTVETVFNLNNATVNSDGNSATKGVVVAEPKITDAFQRAQPALAPRERATRDLADLFGNRFGQTYTRVQDSTNARLMMWQDAPAYASPGDQITYRLLWANLTDNTTGAPVTVFRVPDGTTFVSATNTVSLSAEDNNQAPISLPDANNPRVVWGDSVNPHRTIFTTVTVQVNADVSPNTVICSAEAWTTGDNAKSRVYAPVIKTVVVAPGTDKQLIRGLLIGANAGSTARSASENEGFLLQVDRWLAGAPAIGVGGADTLHLDNGAILIPIGGGHMVAAGAGNLVAAGGGNLVAAGGGNLVAAGGGNLVAAGGGNLVAAGAGNLFGISGLVADLSQSNFYNLVASSYAEKKGITLPGATLVAAGAGNMVAAGGGNLIGQDGGSLVNNDTGAFVMNGGSPVTLLPEISGLITDGGSTLIGNDSNSLIGQAGPDVLTISEAGALTISAGLIGNSGNTLVGNSGNTLVGNSGNTLVAAGAGNMVAAGGGNLITDGGSTALPEHIGTRQPR